MFLSPVTEEEVVGIVRTCNSKISTDSNGMSMAILKKTIQYITKPLTAIFKGALYRIWCGVNRLGDSGVKVV